MYALKLKKKKLPKQTNKIDKEQHYFLTQYTCTMVGRTAFWFKYSLNKGNLTTKAVQIHSMFLQQPKLNITEKHREDVEKQSTF